MDTGAISFCSTMGEGQTDVAGVDPSSDLSIEKVGEVSPEVVRMGEPGIYEIRLTATRWLRSWDFAAWNVSGDSLESNSSLTEPDASTEE